VLNYEKEVNMEKQQTIDVKKTSKFTKKEWAYIFYDWAESAFTVVFATFIFPGVYVYLSTDPLLGNLSNDFSSILYQVIISAIAIIIAIISPILGTISDYKGFKDRFFKIFFYIGIFSSILIPLYPYFPWWFVLIPFSIAYLAYNATNVFYDSYLIDTTTDERMDRVSTIAYAFGYLGGSTIPLVIGILLIQNLDGDLGLQLTFLITTFWWFIFSLPFLRRVKQVYGINPEKQPIKKSFQRLFSTLKEVKKYKKVFLFLIAFFLYIDGVHTIISQAVIFAVNAIPSVTESNVNVVLLPIFIMIQLAAFAFALLFARLSKFIKIETLLFVTIGVYAFISIFGFFINSIEMFTILGLLVATSQGAIQSLSRSYFGKIIPKEKANEFFGLYTVFSRVAAFMGPAIIAGVSSFILFLNNTDQIEGGAMRYGILALVVLFFAGAFIFNIARKLPTDYLNQKKLK
jgi:UMF1 family MFS transporter